MLGLDVVEDDTVGEGLALVDGLADAEAVGLIVVFMVATGVLLGSALIVGVGERVGLAVASIVGEGDVSGLSPALPAKIAIAPIINKRAATPIIIKGFLFRLFI